ncbi:MAG: LysE family transporter [Desulfobacterales bacterium]|nr:LysE family transporter [Desulfobacterales bacterium]
MAPEPDGILQACRVIFSLSFMVALTGAMAPGPLLTYTIIKAARSRGRGYLMGAWIIAGHALLEMGIIVALLLGFSFVLKNPLVVKGIGLVGGLILVWFGASIIRDILQRRISTAFLDEAAAPQPTRTASPNRTIENPVIGGMLISMANPYWWIWWVTIGFAFILEFNISFENWPRLLAFFLGHEAGDLAWYLVVSTLAFFGLRHLNRKVYYSILALCGLFMIAFGIYLGSAPFLKPLT